MQEKVIRVLIADDEPDLLWALQRSLSDEGYEVVTASNGVEALAAASRHRPDLMVLDVAMPGMDGLEVCQALRRDPTLAAVPILFLTVHGAIEERVQALNGGADDYLIKPFDLRELKARLRALLRRSQLLPRTAAGLESEDVLTVGAVTLDLRRRQARVGAKVVPLTPIEFDLLHYLMLHPTELFSAARLLQVVWGYAPLGVTTSVVRWHMRNLRRKLEPDPRHPRFIRTVPCHGYTLLPGGEPDTTTR